MEPQYPALIKRNFFNGPIADIYRALDGKSIAGAFILTFCLIDQLTWIEFGDKKHGYNEWIIKRLLPQDFRYRDKDEELYSVRCGLVHAYDPSKSILSQKFLGYHLHERSPAMHLQRINNPVLNICLYSLLTETIYAAHCMFEEFAPIIPTEQLRRFKQQVDGNRRDPPHFYGEMHPALGVFDKYYPTEANHVKAGYTEHLLYARPKC